MTLPITNMTFLNKFNLSWIETSLNLSTKISCKKLEGLLHRIFVEN